MAFYSKKLIFRDPKIITREIFNMNTVSRYKKRQYRLHELKNTITIESDVKQNIVNELLYSKVDTKLISKMTKSMDEHYNFEYDFSVSPEEAKEFLEKFKNDFNQERFDKLINDCKKDVINSIVTPFGLGKIVAAYDKVGGNVDTIHNVRDEVYATDKEKTAYESRGDYDDKEKNRTHGKNTNYKNKKDTDNSLRQKGKLQNDYGDTTFQEDDKTEVDHVVSTYENHHDRGRVLAEIDNAEISNIAENLKTASKSVNASKGEDSIEIFLKRIKAKEIKIKELEGYPSLSDKQKKELEKLKRTSDVDKEKLRDADEKAREAIDEKINKEYYTSGKFVTNTLKTGANEGTKMGTQQAIGLIMTEFFTAVFDEILDIYKNGFSTGFDDDRFFSVLKERLHNIAQKLKAKWKDVAIAFKDGFLSGFISNLVTTAINMFVTTGKRLVRIIREGIFSLFRAVKLLLFPPNNMTFEEAMHEAKKLIATGLIVSLGVMIEESVAAFIKSTTILTPFADTLSAVFIGAITGLAITMTVYYIDKKKNDKDAMQELMSQTDKKFDSAEQLLMQLAY